MLRSAGRGCGRERALNLTGPRLLLQPALRRAASTCTAPVWRPSLCLPLPRRERLLVPLRHGAAGSTDARWGAPTTRRAARPARRARAPRRRRAPPPRAAAPPLCPRSCNRPQHPHPAHTRTRLLSQRPLPPQQTSRMHTATQPDILVSRERRRGRHTDRDRGTDTDTDTDRQPSCPQPSFPPHGKRSCMGERASDLL